MLLIPDETSETETDKTSLRSGVPASAARSPAETLGVSDPADRWQFVAVTSDGRVV